MKKLYYKIFGGTWQEGEWTYWVPGFFENLRQDIVWFFKRDVQLKVLQFRIKILKAKIKIKEKI